MKHEFGMKLQRYYNYFNVNHPHTRKQTKKNKTNPTIYKQLLQNQEALESSTNEYMHSHKRHGIQVVHSQPPGVRFFHNLSLFTTSSSSRKPDPLSQRTVHTVKPYPVHRALPSLAEVGWLARLVSILGSLSFRCLQSSISHFVTLPTFDVLYSHLRSTDSHSCPRKTGN